MASLGTRLKVKYGLPREPTSEEISEFYLMTKRLMALRKGNYEESAREAAFSVFKGVETWLYESETDTIEMLLKMIEES